MVLLLLWPAASVIGLESATLGDKARPNFLVILADDLGFSDTGCYGGEIATPQLDSLAMGGLRFTDFYNTARCWPTREAINTGYYPQQIRRDGMPGADPGKFGGRGVRPGWARLLPDRLKPLGYRSYHSGKWHMDGEPLENGYDHSLDIEGGGQNNFFKVAGNTVDGRPDKQTDDYYTTIRIADHAIACLREHDADHADQPFFHYLAFTAPHFPLHALPEDIERYRDRYLEGWEALGRERHQRVKALGITQTDLSALEPDIGPPYDFPDSLAQLGPYEVNRPLPWESLTDEQRRFQATKMAIHAAMVDRMDREIGRVLDQLREMGAFENTLVLFLSDNGASAEIMVRGDGHDPEAPMGSAASYLCLGPGFSSASNTPFRRHKTWVHEGGIATPFIVHWPEGIRARNELRTTPAHVIDIAPTILDLAGAMEWSDPGAPLLPGSTLASIFKGDGPPLHEAIWFYHEGNWALRMGDWKILHAIDSRPFPWLTSKTAQEEGSIQPDWQLYHLATDRAEQHDLADKFPERVHEMSRLWFRLRDQWLQDAGE